MPLTRDAVVWAYRVLLDRDPESEDVIVPKMRAYSTTRELRHDMVTSDEYQEKNRDYAQTNERTLVIREIEDGLRLWLDLADHAIGLNILRGRFELNELDFIRRTINDGDSVVDCGAHVGFFAMHLARLVGPNGSVVALEPFQENLECLARSVRENRFEDRLRMEPAAAGARTGEAELVFAPKTINSGGAFLRRPGDPVPTGHETRSIRTVALDDVQVRRPVRFIKADIEGAEPLAFRGAGRILAEDRPVILSELHPHQLERVSGMTAAEFIAEMQDRGYICHLLGAGAPMSRIDDAPASSVTSVIFLPEERAGRAV